MTTRPVSIQLELHVQEDSLAGRATSDSGERQEFTGWLGLMGTIDALLQAERPEEDR